MMMLTIVAFLTGFEYIPLSCVFFTLSVKVVRTLTSIATRHSFALDRTTHMIVDSDTTPFLDNRDYR